MGIEVNENLGRQSVTRVLQLHAQSRPLPVCPEGPYEPGGVYEEQQVVQPNNEVQRWLYYRSPGAADRSLLGLVPPTR